MGVKGAGGRRQKTAAQRELDGSRHRPHHYDQVAPPAGDPVRPAYLNQIEVDHWDVLLELLKARGQLTRDTGQWLIAAVTAYCDWLKWRETAATAPMTFDKVGLSGDKEPKTHPAHVQVRLARQHYINVLKEAGLTPASVSRVVVPKKPEKEEDPFESHQQRRAQMRLVK